ncbi:MAG: glycosyltransferase [Kiritimatiellia bacterium]|nr:glycosyltransferase [Kiritimatiellia bacterium]
MNIHQILAGFADGDAISHEALRLREILRSWDYGADIYCDPATVSPSLDAECRPLSEYSADADDICLHHYGINSPSTDFFLLSAAKKIIIYHNITPAEYFGGFDDAVAAQLLAGRSRLRDICHYVDAVWTVSHFNAAELKALGIENVQVFPLLFSPQMLDITPERLIINKFTDTLENILFVGRIVPNKRIEDLILAFAWFNRTINPYSRLLIVGSNRSAPRYYAMLRMLAGDLDLPNVCFEGFAAPAGLAAYYRVADVYVCPSVHEGYCLPLIEAMHCDLPVIARAAGGMPEAMDGAGVMYTGLDEVELAELISRVLADNELAGKILKSQRERMQRLKVREPEKELRQLLAAWLPSFARRSGLPGSAEALRPGEREGGK